MIQFTVHGRPQQRGSKKAMPNRSGGRPLMVDANPKSGPWMESVANAAAEAMNGATLLDGALGLEAVFHFARPKSHFRSNGELKPNAPKFHSGRPDCDKLLRAIGDGMTGVVYRDDAQLAQVWACKLYTESSERADIRILIR